MAWKSSKTQADVLQLRVQSMDALANDLDKSKG